MKLPIAKRYTLDRFRAEGARILSIVKNETSVENARRALYAHVSEEQYFKLDTGRESLGALLPVVRDCARSWRSLLTSRSDERAGFSNVQALWDLSHGVDRPDLQPGFYAEMTHMTLGLEGKSNTYYLKNSDTSENLTGREAAVRRSDNLDKLWADVEANMSRYYDGLMDDSRARREKRRTYILSALNATEEQFTDWRWQIAHISRNASDLEKLVNLRPEERDSINHAVKGHLPFGITPYYASLFDDDPDAGRDRAIRAQVIPPPEYVDLMIDHHGDKEYSFDFMLEHDTSPVDLITRRYPAIAILKPYNTCPQICVYCQRNWEIDQAMAPGALAGEDRLNSAIDFISQHPALREILVTGGDPLAMTDKLLLNILQKLADIPHVEVIRIGTRTPVTMPMRITQELADALGQLRQPGRREICVITHIEHPYEITPESVAAIDRLKRQGISVFNQQVFSFFVSRRFESSKLRMLLRVCGVDPYYTFMPKGKEETNAYRIPLARLLQEQKEEARLMPGLRRTDEAVYNVPGLGKNYLKAFQHRDLLAVMPDGARVYDFHPWEKGIADPKFYTGYDIPILQYLSRLEAIGEDPDDYESIWYYY